MTFDEQSFEDAARMVRKLNKRCHIQSVQSLIDWAKAQTTAISKPGYWASMGFVVTTYINEDTHALSAKASVDASLAEYLP